MRRRQLLTALVGGATALTGCSGLSPFAERRESGEEFTPVPVDDSLVPSSTPTSTDSTFEHAAIPGALTHVELPTRGRRVAFQQRRVTAPHGVHLEVAFVRGPSADSPAVVRGRLSNGQVDAGIWADGDGDNVSESPPPTEPSGGDEEAVVDLTALPPFHASRGTTADGRRPGPAFVLVPTRADHAATTVPVVERLDGGEWVLQDVDGDSWYPELISLAPGETIDVEFFLVRQDSRPVETGVFEFSVGDRTLALSVWDRDTPGPRSLSRFGSASPPTLPDVSEVRWYHEATPETPVWLEPEREEIDLPGSVAFTLRNRSTEPVQGNLGQWRLFKLVDGAWYRIAPWFTVLPAGVLPPGGARSWTLCARRELSSSAIGEPSDGSATRSDETPSKRAACDESAKTVGGLGGGRYAFEAGPSDGETTHAAMVEVDAPPATLTSRPDLTVDRRSGSTLMISATGSEESDGSNESTVAVERTADADRRLLTEQLLQPYYRPIGDALAAFEPGIDRVELTAGSSLHALPVGDVAFVHDGEAFVARLAEQ